MCNTRFVCFGDDSHQLDARHSHHCEDRRDAESCASSSYVTVLPDFQIQRIKQNLRVHGSCIPDDRIFSGAPRCPCNPCDLSQARGVRSALVNKLYCTDVYCEWVSCLHTPVDFLEFFPRNRNHHHFSDDVGCHEFQLVCHCEVGHCEVEVEDAACGFLRGSL